MRDIEKQEYQICEALATIFEFIGEPGILFTEVEHEYFIMVRGKDVQIVLESFGVGIIPPEGGNNESNK